MKGQLLSDRKYFIWYRQAKYVVEEVSLALSPGLLLSYHTKLLSDLLFISPLSYMLKEMATHSSTLAWKILWMEEPGRLQSMGLQRVRPDWMTKFSLSLSSICWTGITVQSVQLLGCFHLRLFQPAPENASTRNVCHSPGLAGNTAPFKAPDRSLDSK